MIIKPVGTSFYADAVAKLKERAEVELVSSPVKTDTREYPNAIAILYNGEQVGSIAEESLEQRKINKKLLTNEVTGRIVELIIPGETDEFKATYRLDVDLGEPIKSFTEKVDIDFDQENHIYRYKGMPLINATMWLDQYYTSFDASVMANKCANSWGVDATELAELWSSSGDISRDFGTVVHKAIEHYYKFEAIGQQIEEAKGYNPAWPKHPAIRKIVEEFINQRPVETIYTEVLVTDIKNRLCGTIDRLQIIDPTKKICRVQDYKINVGAEDKAPRPKAPYNHLDGLKLTKYQLQMSFYAHILEQHGWTVEGLDAFVYDESWKTYSLNKIPLLKKG